MEVFISWSGIKSRKIAEALREWMPNMLQNVKPYFCPADTEKGSKWISEISKKLFDCKFGILCITSENLQNNWIMFEAGALSNFSTARVSPILFGIKFSQLSGPLTLFQVTNFEEGEIKQLFYNINSLLDPPVPEKTFDYTFSKMWPDLEEKIISILCEKSELAKDINRTDREILEEVLELTRGYSLDQRIKQDTPIYVSKEYESISDTERHLLNEYIFKIGTNIKAEYQKEGEFASDMEEKIFDRIHQIDEVRNASGSPENLRKYIWEFLGSNHL
jgi:hypothetical protein